MTSHDQKKDFLRAAQLPDTPLGHVLLSAIRQELAFNDEVNPDWVDLLVEAVAELKAASK
jgi:hypothetical protein